MAVKASFDGWESDNSVNVSNNTSELYVILKCTTSGSSYNNNEQTANVTINGTKYTSKYKLPANKTTKVFEKWITITHDSDGKKTVNMSYSFPTTPSGGTLKGSKSVTLSTIARKSTISGGSGEIEGRTNIKINRQSSAFTHTIRYAFGTLSGTIVTKTTAIDLGWTIPSSFYSQIPRATKGTGTLTVETFNGNTSLGTNSINFTVTTNESKCSPVINNFSYIADRTDLTKNNKIAIFNISNITAQMNYSLKNSAVLAYARINGKNVNSSGQVSYKCTSGGLNLVVADSRGYSSSIVSQLDGVIPYIELTNNTRAERVGATTGVIKLIASGNYYDGYFDTGNTEKNTLTGKWYYKESTASEFTEGGNLTPVVNSTNNTWSVELNLGDTFDYKKSYDIRVDVSDKLYTKSMVYNVPRGLPSFFETPDGFGGYVSFYMADEKVFIEDDELFEEE